MSAFTHLDRETFNWVKNEIAVTLGVARESLQAYAISDDQNLLFDISNHLHQVVGSLQMLELKSLSTLLLESELLIEDFTTTDSVVEKSALTSLLESAFVALENSFAQIEQGLPENTTAVVELINQNRAVRGLDDVEISSLFSPNIEIFPEIDSEKSLKGEEYQRKAANMRNVYQVNLLQWLRSDDMTALQNIKEVIEEILHMSRFSAVARLWWVASAYADFVAHNTLQNKAVHGRMLRQLDDCLRKLGAGGESALVRDPSEELIKVMLFYTGVSENKTERMEEVVEAFDLKSYFPNLADLMPAVPFVEYKTRLSQIVEQQELPLPVIRQLVGSYFEDDKTDIEQLDEIRQQLRVVASLVAPADVDIVNQVVAECIATTKNLRNGVVERNEESGFHFASALMFLETSLNGVGAVDEHWLQNGQLKLEALQALNNQEEVDASLDGVNLTGSERQALLDVVGSEVEENLKEIETNLEQFSADRTKFALLNGIDTKIRHIRGALQVLGEQKVGLLLHLAENQFTAIEQRETEATAALTEALAIAIGTMEAYVKGLQTGQTGMDLLLDRSITDLEVAIGKTVSRSDVESLLDNTSNALFTWLANQSEFQLFTDVKSGLRDLLILAKKTKLVNVEHLISEQTRLVDVIAQEPAFLTENITNNLQNNMASITVQIIDLYGTTETAEEIKFDEDFAARNQAIRSDDDGIRYHDEMDLSGVSPRVEESPQANLTSTEIGKQNAVDQSEQPMIDEAIFEVFIEESHEVLGQANEQYQACLKDPADLQGIRDLRRSFHTLKGSGRMVGLNNIGEIAWFSESLMNYCLDTSKPLSSSLMEFLRKSLDEINSHFLERYQSQHLIDISQWGSDTEAVDLDGEPLSSVLVQSVTDLVMEPSQSINESIAAELDIDSGTQISDRVVDEKDIEFVTSSLEPTDSPEPMVIDLDIDVAAGSAIEFAEVTPLEMVDDADDVGDIEFIVDAEPVGDAGAIDLAEVTTGLTGESDAEFLVGAETVDKTDDVDLNDASAKMADHANTEPVVDAEIVESVVDMAIAEAAIEFGDESASEPELVAEAGDNVLSEQTIEFDGEFDEESIVDVGLISELDDIALTEHTIEFDDETHAESIVETRSNTEDDDIALAKHTIEFDDESDVESIVETGSIAENDDIALTEPVIKLNDESNAQFVVEAGTVVAESDEEPIVDPVFEEEDQDSALAHVTPIFADELDQRPTVGAVLNEEDDVALSEAAVELTGGSDEPDQASMIEWEPVAQDYDVASVGDTNERVNESEEKYTVEPGSDEKSDEIGPSGLISEIVGEIDGEPNGEPSDESVANLVPAAEDDDIALKENDMELTGELDHEFDVAAAEPDSGELEPDPNSVDYGHEHSSVGASLETDQPLAEISQRETQAGEESSDGIQRSNADTQEVPIAAESESELLNEKKEEPQVSRSRDRSRSSKDHDLQAISSSVIRDPQMREIFLHEAGTNLGRISEQLELKPLIVEEDDVLSISIHTIKGNARTMGLNELAEVFSQAEELCTLKQRSGVQISEPERVCLSLLVRVTKEYLATEEDEAPYFHGDQVAWTGLSRDLDKALAAVAPQLSMLGMKSDRDDEAESETEPNISEDTGSNSGHLSISEDEASARVAAVFDDLDPMDDLLSEPFVDNSSLPLSPEVSEEALPSNELTELERSLDSFEFDSSASADESESIEDSAQDGDLAEIDATLSQLNKDLKSLRLDESDVPDKTVQLKPEESVQVDVTDVKQSIEVESLQDDVEAEEPVEEIEDELPIDSENEVLERPLGEALESELEPEFEERLADQQKSLIPDELTDLIDDNSVGIDSAIAADTSGANNELVQQVEVIESADTAAESEEEFDPELRAIYVEELKTLHHELDNEVASLTNMNEMAPVMANIMRNLHTIKGNSMMANEKALSEVTHHAESFLEQNFIRNTDDLRTVRQTLEQYSDSVDSAIQSFDQGNKYTVAKSVSDALGIGSLNTAPIEPAIVLKASPVAPEKVPGAEQEPLLMSDLEVVENVNAIAASIEKIDSKWKSARGWGQAKPAMVEQFQAMSGTFGQNNLLDPILPLIKQGQTYVQTLNPQNAVEFRGAKALLAELSDAIAANAARLSSGLAIQGVSELQAQINIELSKAGDDDLVAGQVFIDKGSDDRITAERANKAGRAARDRTTALRIKTETLDSLTNFVGDASMNRAQMREDVLAVKSVVEDLYSNIQGFRGQLRELEIEADSKISARSSETVSKQRSDEFDPLELDRYTKLQQLSRGLAESLDELGDIQNAVNSFVYKAETSLQKQDRLNRELREQILQVRLVLFGGVAPQLRQVVRRTARETNKQAELEVIGADVRLDKSILDGIVPALEHMLRNAVDHGIEESVARSKTNKPEVGKIVVECRQVAREILITIRDDGVGLNLEKIKATAIENKLLAEDQPLKPEDILMYISQSGFSTAESLTHISGRGVGMDVVQSTLRRMSGSIVYDFDDQRPGSSFTIRLPISLAVSSAVFIDAGGTHFAVSSRTVERIINVESSQLLKRLKQPKPQIEVDGHSYGLIDLAEYLGYTSKLAMISGKRSVILVNTGVQNIAVIIDELLDTQEIVVKNLGEHMGRIPIYAGATIRANGDVVLMLDLVGLSYYESFIGLPDQIDGTSDADFNAPRVLVVDDSLTVRKSAERDITAMGIVAVLAKDGLDAQVQLGQEIPDMILLDIEMPRMDGFELLEWLKSNDETQHIPVIMISSRATDKYIKKATDLGCSGFLGKPYLLENLALVFNQHLVLETPITLDKG